MNERFGGVDAVLREACETQFTAAVARIEHRGRPVFERSYGFTRSDDLAAPTYVDSRFDLASLSKLFTSTLALDLVSRDALTLDGSLLKWFPEWRGTAHAPITLRMLLAHTSGMQSGADYRLLLGQNVEAFAIARTLAAKPGAGVIYSDLGFIALGSLLARVYGTSLATVVRRVFARSTLGFTPAFPERLRIPATEADEWRGRVQGYVHDEKAFLMGGVAGHAGLFGSAADVASLARTYLDPLQGRMPSLLSVDLARLAVEEAAYDPTLRRALGWALKTSDSNSCGPTFSANSFGHTGFVGTCVWVDPDRDVIGVLLTNTVYFGRSDTRALRAAFYTALIEDISVC